ncbi:hypothetical protein EC973_001993 [Apophysomyces ossiformis]|uniref:FAS1 domain-containing protein n=1 Tax=Apophysomyces ossiformis TaxID=679940 RepID=A0A8H7BHB4_9FUNG|nr:hypothetical protein EC973_001993 [Apophysomyces ossiformis]
MHFAPIVLVVGVLVSLAASQLTGSTILQILNTTQLSPAYEFLRLLNSSSEYRPVMDLLNQTGNITVFAPSDKFYKQFQKQSQGGGQTSSGQGGSSDNQTSNATSTGPPSPFPTWLLTQNFTVADLIKYHIVNSSFLLNDLTNQTVVNSTLSNNQTTSKFPYGLPLLIQSNVTDPSNSSNAGFWVGNGRRAANVVLSDIVASNGVLHIIDNILLPPQAPTEVIKNVSSLSELAKAIQRYPELGARLNSTSNTMERLVRAHFLEGVYYTTNFTEAAGGNGTITVTTAANTSLPITVNGTRIRVNNTINVVESNILMNNGVLHVIDQAFQPQ